MLPDETIKSWLPVRSRGVVMLIGVGFVVGTLCGLLVELLHRRRMARMFAAAARLGFKYNEQAGDETRASFARHLAGVKEVTHLFEGFSEDVPVRIADVTLDPAAGVSFSS